MSTSNNRPSPNERGGRGDLRRGVGSRIRAARVAAGLSQSILGERIGVAQHYVCAIEWGYRSVSVEMLTRIAAGLGIDAKELMP